MLGQFCYTPGLFHFIKMSLKEKARSYDMKEGPQAGSDTWLCLNTVIFSEQNHLLRVRLLMDPRPRQHSSSASSLQQV